MNARQIARLRGLREARAISSAELEALEIAEAMREDLARRSGSIRVSSVVVYDPAVARAMRGPRGGTAS